MISSFDPFGLGGLHENALGMHVARLVTWVSESFRALVGERADTMDHMTVVLVREEDWANRRQNWPPTYDFYSEVVSTIANYEPRAIYFGIQLAKRDFPLPADKNNAADGSKSGEEQSKAASEEVKKFADTIKDVAAKKNIPFIMAIPPKVKGKGRNIRDHLSTLNYPEWASINWKKESFRADVYPLQLSPSETLDEDKTSETLETPAYSIYKKVCQYEVDFYNKPIRKLCKTSWILKDNDTILDNLRPLSLNWRTRYEIASQGISQDEFTNNRDCKKLNGQQAAARTLLSSLDILNLYKDVCPPFLTINAGAFFGKPNVEKSDMVNAIQGRIVLIGLDFDGMDYHEAPIYAKKLPGIYIHAMALENLLRYGPDYPKGFHKSAMSLGMARLGWVFLMLALLAEYSSDGPSSPRGMQPTARRQMRMQGIAGSLTAMTPAPVSTFRPRIGRDFRNAMAIVRNRMDGARERVVSSCDRHAFLKLLSQICLLLFEEFRAVASWVFSHFGHWLLAGWSIILLLVYLGFGYTEAIIDAFIVIGLVANIPEPREEGQKDKPSD